MLDQAANAMALCCGIIELYTDYLQGYEVLRSEVIAISGLERGSAIVPDGGVAHCIVCLVRGRPFKANSQGSDLGK